MITVNGSDQCMVYGAGLLFIQRRHLEPAAALHRGRLLFQVRVKDVSKSRIRDFRLPVLGLTNELAEFPAQSVLRPAYIADEEDWRSCPLSPRGSLRQRRHGNVVQQIIGNVQRIRGGFEARIEGSEISLEFPRQHIDFAEGQSCPL